jgi:hypothetical protein
MNWPYLTPSLGPKINQGRNQNAAGWATCSTPVSCSTDFIHNYYCENHKVFTLKFFKG